MNVLLHLYGLVLRVFLGTFAKPERKKITFLYTSYSFCKNIYEFDEKWHNY